MSEHENVPQAALGLALEAFLRAEQARQAQGQEGQGCDANR